MGAGIYNFSIEQGSDFERIVTYKTSAGVVIPVNGYHASLKIRKSWDSSNPLLELTDIDDHGIVVGDEAGTFTITITAAQSAALDFEIAVYDLEITVPVTLKVYKLIKGQVNLLKEVTK